MRVDKGLNLVRTTFHFLDSSRLNGYTTATRSPEPL